MKNFFFILSTLFIVIFFSFIGIFLVFFASPYLYKKLTLSYNYCQSYGKLDYELGWVLKESAESCISLKNYISGEVFFDSNVYINKDGFRDSNINKSLITNQIVAFGDSHTFGYGLNYEDTWPAILSENLLIEINNLGVPGYSVLNSYLLLRRNLTKLKPKILIFFDLGASSRAWCPKADKEKQLMPCYFFNLEKREIEIIYPKKDYFDKQIKKNKFPGGYLATGYDFYDYLFFKLKNLIIFYFESTGNFFSFFNNNKHKENIEMIDNNLDHNEFKSKVLFYEFKLFYDLTQNNNFKIIFVDGRNNYIDAKNSISNFDEKKFIYLNKDFWSIIDNQHESIGYENVQIPKDGHFNRVGNDIIAKELEKIIGALSK